MNAWWFSDVHSSVSDRCPAVIRILHFGTHATTLHEQEWSGKTNNSFCRAMRLRKHWEFFLGNPLHRKGRSSSSIPAKTNCSFNTCYISSIHWSTLVGRMLLSCCLPFVMPSGLQEGHCSHVDLRRQGTRR